MIPGYLSMMPRLVKSKQWLKMGREYPRKDIKIVTESDANFCFLYLLFFIDTILTSKQLENVM